MIEGLQTVPREEYHREHTIKRLEERWDIVISHDRYDELCQVVRQGNGFLVRKLSKDASVFVIAIDAQLVPVVFSRISQQISTAWPKEALQRLSTHYQESLYIRHKLKHHLPKLLWK